jgi:hypothetical protein
VASALLVAAFVLATLAGGDVFDSMAVGCAGLEAVPEGEMT